MLAYRDAARGLLRKGDTRKVASLNQNSNGDVTYADPVTMKQVTVHQNRSPEAHNRRYSNSEQFSSAR
jgi:hypothetical protein